MKKSIIRLGSVLIALLLFALTSLIFVSCNIEIPPDPILSSLGEYSHKEYYSEDAVQDLTIYAKYHFTSPQLTDNVYFEKIPAESIANIKRCIVDFEELLAEPDPNSKVAPHYDFDQSIIDTDDYYYLHMEEATRNDCTFLVRYDIYFFDTQTNTLYYIHDNI